MITTNAVRFRLIVKEPKELSEWGCTRSSSSDAAVLASKYCYLAGFDSTSNILAAKAYNIPLNGTYRTFINAFPNSKILDNLNPRVCELCFSFCNFSIFFFFKLGM